MFIADVWRPAVEDRGRAGSDAAVELDGAAQDEARALAAFGKALLAAQTDAYAKVDAAVDSARFRALAIDAAAWLEAGPWTTDAAPGKTRRDKPAAGVRRQGPGQAPRPHPQGRPRPWPP